MSTEHTCATPTSQSKKRELTSPIFEIDTKKNKLVTVASRSEATPGVVIRQDSTESEMMAPGSSSAEKSTSIFMPESEMLKLSTMLKDIFKSEIVGLVKGTVDGVLDSLNEQVSKLELTNKKLVEENGLLRQRVETLEGRVGKVEQYSRRNCLHISGINEEPLENIDNVVLKLAADIDADVELPEIDRSHRLGVPTKARSKPRNIIVKFAKYRSRQTFYKKRTLLKQKGHNGVFVNEDLTNFRNGLLYNARRLVKVDLVKGAWSSDGNILVKDNNDKVHRINTISDLFPFGFLVTGPGQPVVPSGHRRPPWFRPGAHTCATDRSYAEVTADVSASMDHSGGHA